MSGVSHQLHRLHCAHPPVQCRHPRILSAPGSDRVSGDWSQYQEVCLLLLHHLCLIILQGGAPARPPHPPHHHRAVPHLPPHPRHQPHPAGAAGHWPGLSDHSNTGQTGGDAQLWCSASPGLHPPPSLL